MYSQIHRELHIHLNPELGRTASAFADISSEGGAGQRRLAVVISESQRRCSSVGTWHLHLARCKVWLSSWIDGLVPSYQGRAAVSQEKYPDSHAMICPENE